MNARFLSARVAIVFTALALLALAGLHVLSPEFDPGKRVVSEYALGRHGWLLSVMFLSWGLGTWSLVPAIQPDVSTLPGRIGLVLLVTTGLGEVLAAFFDVNWPKMHGVAGAGSPEPSTCRHADQHESEPSPSLAAAEADVARRGQSHLAGLGLDGDGDALSRFEADKPSHPNRLAKPLVGRHVLCLGDAVGLIALRVRRDQLRACRNMLRHTDERGHVPDSAFEVNRARSERQCFGFSKRHSATSSKLGDCLPLDAGDLCAGLQRLRATSQSASPAGSLDRRLERIQDHRHVPRAASAEIRRSGRQGRAVICLVRHRRRRNNA